MWAWEMGRDAGSDAREAAHLSLSVTRATKRGVEHARGAVAVRGTKR